jgi:hypothetical protein
LALASFDGEPVCDLCLFGVAKECDLSGMLRKTRPLPVVGGPVKVVPEEAPARRVEGLA